MTGGGRLVGSGGSVEGGGGRDAASLRGVVAGFSNGAGGAATGLGVVGLAMRLEAFLTGTGLVASKSLAFVGAGAAGAGAAASPLPFVSSRSTSGASLNLDSSSSIL
jgi:hypothetical protein